MKEHNKEFQSNKLISLSRIKQKKQKTWRSQPRISFVKRRRESILENLLKISSRRRKKYLRKHNLKQSLNNYDENGLNILILIWLNTRLYKIKFFNMSKNSRYDLFDKFISLHELSEISQSSMIKATVSSEGIEVYDFDDRYKIKDFDHTKKRFCQDTKVSK